MLHALFFFSHCTVLGLSCDFFVLALRPSGHPRGRAVCFLGAHIPTSAEPSCSSAVSLGVPPGSAQTATHGPFSSPPPFGRGCQPLARASARTDNTGSEPPPRFATATLATNPLARRRRWAPASRPMTAPVRPLPVRAPPPPTAAGRPHHRLRRKTRSDGARRRALPRDECRCRARGHDADGGVCAAALARPAVRNSWGGGGAARGGGGAFHQAPMVAAAGRRHPRWGLNRCGGVSRGRADATGSATTRIDAVVRSRIVRRGIIMTNQRARRLIPTGSSRASSRLLLHPWLSPASPPLSPTAHRRARRAPCRRGALRPPR